MSHPRRRESAAALVAKAPEGLLRLVLDPEPDGPPTALRSAMLAWSAVADDATHHLVLQDDAIPSEGFFERVAEVVAEAPHAAISFFTSWNSRNGAAVRLGALRGARWVGATGEYTPTVALVLPAEPARGFADYARRNAGGRPDDVVMRRYLDALGVPTYLTVPNLVEHDDFPSVARNDAHGLRRAACFAPVPAGADWRLGPGLAALDTVPFCKHGTAWVTVRDGGRWRTVEAERYGRRLGFDVEGFRALLPVRTADTADAADTADTADAAGRQDPFAALRPEAVEAVWITAGLTGFLSRHGRTDPSYGRAGPGGPPADAAISTLGPGGLCAEVGATTLTALRGRLTALALRGFESGAALYDRAPGGRAPDDRAPGGREEAGSGGTRRAMAPRAVAPRGGGRLSVTGTPGDLARALARDLADQNYEVASLTGDLGAEPERREELRGTGAVIHVGKAIASHPVLSLAAELGIGQVICIDIDADTGGDDATDTDTFASTDASTDAEVMAGCPGAAEPPPVMTVLRIGVPYGPGILEGNSLMTEFVRNALLRRPITLRSPLPEPVRYLYTGDLYRAVERALSLGRPGVYTVHDERWVSALDLAEAVCAAVRSVPVETAGTAERPGPGGRAGRPPGTADRAGKDRLGRPRVPLTEGLRSFAQWLAYEADPEAETAARTEAETGPGTPGEPTAPRPGGHR